MKQKTKRKVKYKATLTFPLDDSFDTNKFKRALTADGAYISLYDINELIIKHINLVLIFCSYLNGQFFIYYYLIHFTIIEIFYLNSINNYKP